MRKERLKGAVIGFVLCALLSVSVVAVANTQSVMREITYGINVMLNGEIVQFNEDSRPFVMEGRTFLPIRALAELLDLPVDFNPATNTAIIGRTEARRGTPVSELFFDGSSSIVRYSGQHRIVNSHNVEEREQVMMGGDIYNGVIAFHAIISVALTEHMGAAMEIINMTSLSCKRRSLKLGQVAQAAAQGF
ncbi:MAG: copper amine oxidase N-terminal domain-containing protein [Clostridiales bacterium]|nr:copper amine oxidase N-terminal domain-containing protein [Clostridiales bacterium]